MAKRKPGFRECNGGDGGSIDGPRAKGKLQFWLTDDWQHINIKTATGMATLNPREAVPFCKKLISFCTTGGTGITLKDLLP